MEPYPQSYNGEDNESYVDGVWTFTPGLGTEAVFHAYLPDRSRILIERRRVEDGQLQARFELPTGPDRDGDGIWDGNIMVSGVLDVPAEGGVRQALILLSQAGYDLGPRGVQAVDAETGEVLWDYFVGPNPMAPNILLANITGDERREIIFGGSAVDNIHNLSFHGTRDDTSRVFALNAMGELLWSHAFAPYSAGVVLMALENRDDSQASILVGSSSGQASCNGLFLLDGAGAVMDSFPVPAGVRLIANWSGPTDETEILVLASDKSVFKVAFEDTFSLAAERQLPEQTHLVGIADLAPTLGHEALLQGKEAWLLSSSLDILAHGGFQNRRFAPGSLGLFHITSDSTILYSQGPEGSWSFSVDNTPLHISWPVVGSVLGLGLLVPLLWQWRKGKQPNEATKRELQLQLLERLKLSGHGAIGGLSAVRRLVWNLNTLVHGFTQGEERLVVMRDLLEEIKTNQLPKLEAVIELSRLAGLEGEGTGHLSQVLSQLTNSLGKTEEALQAQEMSAGVVQDLKDDSEAAENAFQGLRKRVEKAFRVDPSIIVKQSLAAHTDSISSAGVEVSSHLEGIPTCCMDGEELAFIIDNLIENSVRAMYGGQNPRLTITWKDGGGWVTLFFADTGCGIVPDDWQRVFEAGQSSRAGGGLGLPRSREVLRKYGGGLMVKSSELTRGTTMALTLSVAS